MRHCDLTGVFFGDAVGRRPLRVKLVDSVTRAKGLRFEGEGLARANGFILGGSQRRVGLSAGMARGQAEQDGEREGAEKIGSCRREIRAG